jgi:hypothetical protein
VLECRAIEGIERDGARDAPYVFEARVMSLRWIRRPNVNPAMEGRPARAVAFERPERERAPTLVATVVELHHAGS